MSDEETGGSADGGVDEAAGDPVLVAVDFTAGELRVLFSDLHGKPVERGAWPLPPLAGRARVVVGRSAGASRRSSPPTASAAPRWRSPSPRPASSTR